MHEEWILERVKAEQGQLVMPFYLICDISYSMQADIPALNDGVNKLCRAVAAEPVVDDVAQICIMSFSDTARVLMQLGPISESVVPTLAVEGATNYGAAFRLLAQSIRQDSDRLKEQGYKIYRPCAFFLTDGAPTDHDWHRTFTDTLTYDRQTGHGFKAHPIFVPFGFRDARSDVLKQLAYPPERGKWYLAKDTTVEQALAGILQTIMQTVVIAGRSAGTGQPAITQQPPIPGSGILQGGSEYDPDYV
jgi:uncharacterized protein YegL